LISIKGLLLLKKKNKEGMKNREEWSTEKGRRRRSRERR